jgi:(1->4)-alpha-D-glucan 1-alpha-D-glucosylmutase
VVDGLRVDHPDGLRDPKGYFDQLRCRAPQAWIVAEKILEPAERLPEDWPVDGTTGYDFANRCLGLFIDPSGEAPLTRLYEELAGESREYPEVAHAKKHQVLRELLASDVNRLVALLIRICERHRDYRDYTRRELDDALREVIASFPVYRTYVRPDAGAVSADDVHHVGEATASAGEHRPDLDPDLFAFIRDLLLLRHRGDVEDEFTWRFQQTTAPVMAKAVEDTAFYSYNRLVCLNEVGGDPDRFGVSLADFHAACAAAAKRWPFSMLASSTHDTKRSEDVRARLALLSEVPDEWGENVRRWVEMNAHQKTLGIPDPNTEYLLYQTLVGAHPLDADRAVAYMEKASKEAKEHTSWLDPNPEHDAALRDFVAAILQDHDFTASLRDFAVRLTQPGRVNSLAAKLLTLTSPGVGDIYQGTELWDLTLVDPDNRRPVDFALRRRLLGELDDLSAADVWARAEEGLPKLLVVKRALELRRERPAAFTGAYEPLYAVGPKASHLVAFARGGDVVTAVPRLLMGLQRGWSETTLELPRGTWTNRLTGAGGLSGEQPVGSLFKEFPVALLARNA